MKNQYSKSKQNRSKNYSGSTNRKNRSNKNNSYRNNKSNRYRGRNNRGNNRGNVKKSNINPARYVAKAVKSSSESIYSEKVAFDNFNLEPVLFRNIKRKNYVNPTKIQAQAIPHSLKGNDVLGLANTGSGKTAAFLIPMINKILKSSNQKCIIITPTRELTAQIQSELKAFSKDTKIKSILVIGGASIRNQISELRRKPQFVIATPGRLNDLVQRSEIRLEEFNNIVLDEVDRMLDMGFVREIKLIISRLRQKKQSLFFSATINSKVETIARSLLKNPRKVQVGNELDKKKNVDQDIVKVNPSEKLQKLSDLLHNEEFEKVLIFLRTKRRTDNLSTKLNQRGFKVDSIHGGKSQGRRNRVIQKFRQDSIRILVATDVASRGLDIDDISHVINYDEPRCFDDYIHRIGRTGRAGKTGKALTFVE